MDGGLPPYMGEVLDVMKKPVSPIGIGHSRDVDRSLFFGVGLGLGTAWAFLLAHLDEIYTTVLRQSISPDYSDE